MVYKEYYEAQRDDLFINKITISITHIGKYLEEEIYDNISEF